MEFIEYCCKHSVHIYRVISEQLVVDISLMSIYSVAILIHHVERKSLLFVRQFRPGEFFHISKFILLQIVGVMHPLYFYC